MKVLQFCLGTSAFKPLATRPGETSHTHTSAALGSYKVKRFVPLLGKAPDSSLSSCSILVCGRFVFLVAPPSEQETQQNKVRKCYHYSALFSFWVCRPAGLKCLCSWNVPDTKRQLSELAWCPWKARETPVFLAYMFEGTCRRILFMQVWSLSRMLESHGSGAQGWRIGFARD